MQQTETTTVQTGPTTAQTGDTSVEAGGTTVQTGGTTVQTGGTTVQTEQTTLHDFTLGLLTDLDARAAFQQDPLGALQAAGLGDITAGDVQDILPLVLDAASVANVDAIDEVLGGAGDLDASSCLKLVSDNVEGVTAITDVAAPSSITALASDFSGLGDVSGTLDSALLTGNEAVSTVSGLGYGNVTEVAGVADVKAVTDVLVEDLDADVLVKDVVDVDVLVKNTDVLVSDVVDVKDVVDVTGNVVQDVAQVGDVHNSVGQVVGDLHLGDVLDGGIGNGNDTDIHF
ncbi:IniB N-terminal domain-containing protein [Lentzea sp. E54]|uniref:IniB N-terminal domain-containing protein n=1 Tax=Lentzea xerophila TaxID=3435883 RepID=UPI003DA49FEA